MEDTSHHAHLAPPPASILIVETDPFVQMDISATLAEIWPDAALHHVSDADEALPMLERLTKLDLAVLDAPFSALERTGLLSVLMQFGAAILHLNGSDSGQNSAQAEAVHKLEKPFSQDSLTAAVVAICAAVLAPLPTQTGTSFRPDR